MIHYVTELAVLVMTAALWCVVAFRRGGAARRSVKR